MVCEQKYRLILDWQSAAKAYSLVAHQLRAARLLENDSACRDLLKLSVDNARPMPASPSWVSWARGRPWLL